jgi:twitching motility protein PilT
MQQGVVSPHEAYMKAIDKNRFRVYLPPEEEGL